MKSRVCLKVGGKLSLSCGLLLCAFLFAGCERDSPSPGSEVLAAASADTVLFNGRIYTSGAAPAWVEAVAIRDGDFVFAGTNTEAEQYMGPETERVDFQGAMVMPGINDGHAHPGEGGIGILYECRFAFDSTPDQIAARLRLCIEENPDSEWITGGQWTSDFFRNHDLGSPRHWLDAISTDQAILLIDDSGHNGWANSKALELIGVNRDTPDPGAGTYVRGADGELNGLLYEVAANQARAHVTPWTLEQHKAGILAAMAQGNSFGVTGINEAMVFPGMLEAYAALDTGQQLTARVTLSLVTPMEYRAEPLNVADYIAMRDRYQGQDIDARFVKVFLDGVPTAARTALMLDDYLTDEAHPEVTRGHLQVDAGVLIADLIALDAAGFTVKLHAAGDGAVRAGLDALQIVRETNGDSGLRHELAHAGYIDPVDLPRFAALNVVADLSPALWYPSPVIDSLIGALGERGRNYFPVKDLLASGANTLLGSDWPAVAVDLNPWPAIEGLVTRRNPYTDSEETLWPEQAISLEQALAIATMAGAKALRREQRTGSIEVGKSADFIMLNQNLFEIPAQKISDTEVEQTWFKGKLVYERSAP